MRIDKKRFLLLTASLSAGACTSGTPSAVPPREIEHVARAPDEPEPEPEPEPVATPETVDAGSSGRVAGPMEEGAGYVSSLPSTHLDTNPKCNDMIGKPGSCTFKAPGPQCESFHDLASECRLMTKHLKPKVAARAVSCIAQKSGTPDICEFALASRCTTEAIRDGVCPDKASAKACAGIVSNCSNSRGGSFSMDECRAAYSSVLPKSRTRMLSCISEFCTVEHCLYQL